MSTPPNLNARNCGVSNSALPLQGYIASRVLSRRACYVIKMDHKAIPALDTLQRFLYEKQVIWGSLRTLLLIQPVLLPTSLSHENETVDHDIYVHAYNAHLSNVSSCLGEGGMEAHGGAVFIIEPRVHGLLRT